VETVNIILAGVGGQGIILAGKIIAQCAFQERYDVKENELHGMAQREGSVISHVRFGPAIYSPLIPQQKADFLIALEELEALRYVHYLKPQGRVIMSERKKEPSTVKLNNIPYPEHIKEQLDSLGFQVELVNAVEIARQLGSPKVENMVLLGTLSKYLPFSASMWEDVIKKSVPSKTIAMNLQAFQQGKTSPAEVAVSI
jgi:indolepyruvate ferredoxin oxidoreductase, beta subunit